MRELRPARSSSSYQRPRTNPAVAEVHLFLTLLNLPESNFSAAFKMFDVDHSGYPEDR